MPEPNPHLFNHAPPTVQLLQNLSLHDRADFGLPPVTSARTLCLVSHCRNSWAFFINVTIPQGIPTSMYHLLPGRGKRQEGSFIDSACSSAGFHICANSHAALHQRDSLFINMFFLLFGSMHQLATLCRMRLPEGCFGHMALLRQDDRRDQKRVPIMMRMMMMRLLHLRQ